MRDRRRPPGAPGSRSRAQRSTSPRSPNRSIRSHRRRRHRVSSRTRSSAGSSRPPPGPTWTPHPGRASPPPGSTSPRTRRPTGSPRHAGGGAGRRLPHRGGNRAAREPSPSAGFTPGHVGRSTGPSTPRPGDLRQGDAPGAGRRANGGSATRHRSCCSPASDFPTAFRQRVLYFLDQTGTVVVPDVRHVVIGQTPANRANRLIVDADRRAEQPPRRRGATASSPRSRRLRSNPVGGCRGRAAGRSHRRRCLHAGGQAGVGRAAGLDAVADVPADRHHRRRRAAGSCAAGLHDQLGVPRSIPTGWPEPVRWPPIRYFVTPDGAIVGLLDGKPAPGALGTSDAPAVTGRPVRGDRCDRGRGGRPGRRTGRC